MRLHCRLAEEEALGDLGVRETRRDELEDLALAIGQRREAGARSSGVGSVAANRSSSRLRDGGCEQCLAVCDDADGVDELRRRTSLSRNPLAPARIAA